MKQDITAVILAGGRSSRMGGIDKGLLEIDGRPLIAHVIDRISPQSSNLMINANNNLDHYRQYGYPVIRDQLQGHQGPLAGFLASLRAITTPYAVFVPCDSPLLGETLVSRLAGAREEADAEIAVAHDGERLQSICALIPAHLEQSLDDFLQTGERKIDRWYAKHHTVRAGFSDLPDTFVNINTPEELNRIRTRAGTMA